jgi:non-specific serine/threonine protein kinase
MKDLGDADGVLRLAGALTVYWHHRGDLAEGRQWLEWALAHTPDTPTATRSRALSGLSLIIWSLGETDAAEPPAQAALAIAEAIGHTELTALALHLLGLIEWVRGRFEQARSLMTRALTLWRALHLQTDEATALGVLSGIALSLGNTAAGRVLAEEALAIFRSLDHPSGAAYALAMLAQLAMDRHDDRTATHMFRDALHLWSDIDARWSSLGRFASHAGGAAFPRWAGGQDRRTVIRAFAGLAGIAARHGQPEHAATLLGAIDARLPDTSRLYFLISPADRDRSTSVATSALGERRFAELHAAGRALSLPEAVALAQTVEIPDAPTAAERSRLTPRELEVLRLLAQGQSNRAIADALSLSERTVEHHVLHILTKLNLDSRIAAALYAVRNGLA